MLFGTLGMILLFGAAAIIGYFQLQDWSKEPFPLSRPATISFPRGTPLLFLSGQLEKKGLVSSAALFRVWVKYFSDFTKFQAGQYRFEESVSPEMIARTIIDGDIYEPVVVQITVPEGFTNAKIAARLEALNIGDQNEILDLMNDPIFLKEHLIPSSSTEGFLYPATYNFTVFPTSKEVLTKMVDTFWERIPEEYEVEVKEKGLTLTEAVTFASLIELETRVEEEKPKVAEVIWRRLHSNVALAIDASIIYGIDSFDGNLRWKHLKDKSNPYNTRVHRGLPPTPIGSPSLSSLLAVLHPSNEGYFYYVLDLEDGTHHHFSKSLQEHNSHVKKLVQEQKKRKQQQ
ncbi:MAG: endolytic transglycosylase MltG [Bdellovibrionales bacterium]|nr:endolytic transglycosylase MltG [Bdellovibrionales bacterium]